MVGGLRIGKPLDVRRSVGERRRRYFKRLRRAAEATDREVRYAMYREKIVRNNQQLIDDIARGNGPHRLLVENQPETHFRRFLNVVASPVSSLRGFGRRMFRSSQKGRG